MELRLTGANLHSQRLFTHVGNSLVAIDNQESEPLQGQEASAEPVRIMSEAGTCEQ